jgi:hypothetical protein
MELTTVAKWAVNTSRNPSLVIWFKSRDNFKDGNLSQNVETLVQPSMNPSLVIWFNFKDGNLSQNVETLVNLTSA